MWQVSSALRLLKEEHKYDKALEILDAHPHLQVLIKTSSQRGRHMLMLILDAQPTIYQHIYLYIHIYIYILCMYIHT